MGPRWLSAVQSERDRIYARKSRSTASAPSAPSSATPAAQTVLGDRSSSTSGAALAGPSTLSSALKRAPVPKPVPLQLPTVRQLSHAADQLEALKQAENLLLASTSLQSPVRSSARTSVDVSEPALFQINSPPACSPAVSTPSFADPLASAAISQEIRRLATLADLADAIKEQLLLLVEWAKTLRPFMQLTIDDQVPIVWSTGGRSISIAVVRRWPCCGVTLRSTCFWAWRADRCRSRTCCCSATTRIFPANTPRRSTT